VLAWHNIKSVGLPHPVKDHLGLRTPGVYRISCECGRVYIGQTGRSVDMRLKQHQRHIRLEHPDKSAVAEHSIYQGQTNKKKTNSVAHSQRANYTDWATAICRWNLVQTFVDRGVSHGQRGGSPTVVKSTRDTAFDSTIHLSSPRKPDIWTALSGRPLRLNSTLTTSTDRVVFVSVNHGSLLSAP
jgi:hypothetical protein